MTAPTMLSGETVATGATNMKQANMQCRRRFLTPTPTGMKAPRPAVGAWGKRLPALRKHKRQPSAESAPMEVDGIPMQRNKPYPPHHPGLHKKNVLSRSSKKALKQIIEAQETTIQFMATLLEEKEEKASQAELLHNDAQGEIQDLSLQLCKTNEQLEHTQTELQESRNCVAQITKENTRLTNEIVDLKETLTIFKFHHGSEGILEFPYLPVMDHSVLERENVAGGYEFHRILGEGHLGTVFAATNLEHDNGQEYAVKRIEKNQLNCYRYIEQLNFEVRALRTLKHNANIVQLKETFHGHNGFYMVFEKAWMDVHDLSKTPHFNHTVLQQIMAGVFGALQYIHQRNYAHMDIKPDNILIKMPAPSETLSSKHVVLCDFGLCVFSASGPPGTVLGEGGQVVGTNHFFAPELCDEEVFDAALADMWSCGATLLELAWNFPRGWCRSYEGFSDATERADMMEVFPFQLFQYLDSDNLIAELMDERPSMLEMPKTECHMMDLIVNNLLVRPEERMNSANVMEHPWFTNVQVAATHE